MAADYTRFPGEKLPHFTGPADERRTVGCILHQETGLPLFVCNRTGQDDTLSFLDAESVVIKNGERLMTFHAPDSTLLLVDWDLRTQTLGRQVSQPL